MNNTILTTQHLIIRKFNKEDAEQLYKNHLEEKAKKWFPNETYEDIDEAGEAIEFFADCVNNDKLPYVLAVEQKETGELIGDTGVNEVEGVPSDVEIGYQICEKYSGKGYATELAIAMTEFSFDHFGVRTIFGRVMHGNDASVRVLEKAGYSFVNEEFGAEDDPYGNGMLVYKKEAESR
ncbi:MAG: GNAT family N-acetyltransferase [Lachnospiraceae bacterium]|nr:GNAT family N-acetyltransferase [Lachnospiraceae bacterium]